MLSIDTSAPPVAPTRWSTILRSRWLWCLAAVALVCLRDLLSDPSRLLTSLGDSDDATRLYEVRRLLSGTSWFDMTLPRLGGATPLISHWSRLIDLPMAMIWTTFGMVMAPSEAELALRIVWPMLVLGVFLRLLIREAEWQAGASVAWIVLFLAVTCSTGLAQLRPGRVDHYNVMILGTVAGLLVLLRARLEPRQQYLAGALIGIALAVGYEPLAIVMPALGAAALFATIDIRWLTGVRNMAIALGATLAVVFFVTVAPSQWMVSHCDALSLNMVLLVGLGASGLVINDRYGRSCAVAYRIALLVAAGATGSAAYGAMDTRCFGGPFGQVDPAIKPIWLDSLDEMWSVFKLLALSPTSAVSILLLVAVGLAAAILRWDRRRTPESAALLALLLIALPPSLWMMKLTPYAGWIAVFSLALAIADLRAIGNASVLTVQLCGALFLNQTALQMLTAPLLAVARVPNASASEITPDDTKCHTTASISALATLPKGRFVGAIDFGPYIVALTQHEALAAPYHRIDRASFSIKPFSTRLWPRLKNCSIRPTRTIWCCASPVRASAPPNRSPRIIRALRRRSERALRSIIWPRWRWRAPFRRCGSGGSFTDGLRGMRSRNR